MAPPSEGLEKVRELLAHRETEALRESSIRRQAHAARMSLYFLGLAHRVRDSWLARRLKAEAAVDRFLPFALEQVESLMAPSIENDTGAATVKAIGDHPVFADDATPSRLKLNEMARLRGVASSIHQELLHAGIERRSSVLDAPIGSEQEPGERATGSAAEGDDGVSEPAETGEPGEPAALDFSPDQIRKNREVADRVGDLLRRFLIGLHQSEPRMLVAVMSFGVPNILRWLHKNLALLWTIPVVGFVALRVEAVNSLFRNDPLYTALYVALVALPVVLSMAVAWQTSQQRDPDGNLRPRAPVWDIGGRPFRSISPPAIEPNRFAERWAATAESIETTAVESDAERLEEITEVLHRLAPPRRSGLARVIFWGRALRLALYMAWWLAVGVAVRQFSEASQPFLTTYVIVALLAVVLVLAHLVDFWDFTNALPVRFFLLLGGLAVAAMVALGWEEFFFVPTLLGAFGFAVAAWTQPTRRWVLAGVAGLLLVLAGLSWSKKTTNDLESWREQTATESDSTESESTVSDDTESDCTESDDAESEKGKRERAKREKVLTVPRLRLAAPDEPSREDAQLAFPEWPAGGPDDGPVVVIAASGGGSRAAIYTAHTLEALHREFGEVARNIQAISSVSGGSLANAAYIVRRMEHDATDAAVEDLVEAVSGDYLRPTLKGAARPGTSRGRAIEEHWETHVGLGCKRFDYLLKKWRKRKGALAPFPMPLFNTSTLDGHDVVVSPLEKQFYTRLDHEPVEPLCGGTWVHNRDAVYGLDDLIPSYNPSLAGAVRASANFPFGFPLVWVKTRQPISFSPLPDDRRVGTPKSVYLTDGGALSNSGMWSLYNLLSNPQLVEPLKERGVLLIVVDASKMPIYPAIRRKLGTLWSAIGDQSPIGQALHRAMLDRLGSLYCNRIALFEVNLTPIQNRNILTTWALSKTKREELEVVFEESWSANRDSLEERWRLLTEGAPPNTDCGSLLKTVRPPLD